MRVGRRGRILGLRTRADEMDEDTQKQLLQAAGISPDVQDGMDELEKQQTLKAILDSNPGLFKNYTRNSSGSHEENTAACDSSPSRPVVEEAAQVVEAESRTGRFVLESAHTDRIEQHFVSYHSAQEANTRMCGGEIIRCVGDMKEALREEDDRAVAAAVAASSHQHSAESALENKTALNPRFVHKKEEEITLQVSFYPRIPFLMAESCWSEVLGHRSACGNSQFLKLLFDIQHCRLRRAQMWMDGPVKYWGEPVTAGAHVNGCLISRSSIDKRNVRRGKEQVSRIEESGETWRRLKQDNNDGSAELASNEIHTSVDLDDDDGFKANSCLTTPASRTTNKKIEETAARELNLYENSQSVCGGGGGCCGDDDGWFPWRIETVSRKKLQHKQIQDDDESNKKYKKRRYKVSDETGHVTQETSTECKMGHDQARFFSEKHHRKDSSNSIRCSSNVQSHDRMLFHEAAENSATSNIPLPNTDVSSSQSSDSLLDAQGNLYSTQIVSTAARCVSQPISTLHSYQHPTFLLSPCQDDDDSQRQVQSTSHTHILELASGPHKEKVLKLTGKPQQEHTHMLKAAGKPQQGAACLATSQLLKAEIRDETTDVHPNSGLDGVAEKVEGAATDQHQVKAAESTVTRGHCQVKQSNASGVKRKLLSLTSDEFSSAGKDNHSKSNKRRKTKQTQAAQVMAEEIDIDPAYSKAQTRNTNVHIDPAYSKAQTRNTNVHIDPAYSKAQTRNTNVHIDTTEPTHNYFLSKCPSKSESVTSRTSNKSSATISVSDCIGSSSSQENNQTDVGCVPNNACPICRKCFAQSQLEVHASSCGEDLADRSREISSENNISISPTLHPAPASSTSSRRMPRNK